MDERTDQELVDASERYATLQRIERTALAILAADISKVGLSSDYPGNQQVDLAVKLAGALFERTNTMMKLWKRQA